MIIKKINNFVKNFFSNYMNYELSYIVEPNWSIMWDGKNIINKLRKKLKGRISLTTANIRNQIVHFGSEHCVFRNNRIKNLHRSNKYILTWFHINPNDKNINQIKKVQKCFEFIHTSNKITEKELIKIGVDKKKIVRIHLGVDMNLFKPVYTQKKNELKKKLGLPNNKVVIGSFQKDGNEWGVGLEPKLIKGPDIFCDVVENLAKTFDIHILLTGPARGYVKKRLKKANISYTHKYLKNYQDIVKYYQSLDLYLVTSRVEGGPKAIIEAMACGIPLVSTKIGMAPEVIKHNFNGLLADIEDVKKIIEFASEILKNKKLKKKFIKNSLQTVKKYSLKKISDEYYEKLYYPLLK